MAAGLAGAGALAGCIEAPDIVDSGNPSGAAAFYTLMDWGNQVGGDVLAFETPVEVGEMGHGWDPDADIVPELAQHDVFYYLGTPEFQWAIDAAAELDEQDVALIDGLDALDPDAFLPFTGNDDEVLRRPDEDVAYDPDATDIAEFEIVYGDEIAAYWHDNHWHGQLPEVPLDDRRRLEFNVVDAAGNVLPLGDEFDVVVQFAPDAPEQVLDIEHDEGAVLLYGQETGQTLLHFEVEASGTSVFDTSADPIVASVVPAEDVAIDAFHDPHVWTDPVLAGAMVDHFAEALAERFPDGADGFRANAETYRERLDAVDEALETLAAEAELDVAVVVAHDAFQYLEARYGFEFRTPVGVTPDAAESIQDVARLAETVDEHGIDTILFDPFEAPDPDQDLPQAAQLLLERTNAERAEPISALEGVTPAWRESGYGWVELMENINIPSLRRALRAQ